MAAPGLVVGFLFFLLPLLAVLREAFTGGGVEFLKSSQNTYFGKASGTR